MVRLFAHLLTLLLTTTLAQAATVTVAPSDDLLGVLQRLGPGDTALLADGTYTPGTLQNLAGGTSWDAAVTIKAAPGARPVLLSTPGEATLMLVRTTEQYLVFENLIFDGNNRQGSTVAVSGYPGPSGAHHIRFVNCEFRNAHGEISLSHTHHIEFVGGAIHDNGDASGLRHGIYLSSESSDNLIDGMQIYNNQGYGIHMYNYDGRGSDRNIIRNNTIYNNALCCAQDNVLIAGTDHGTQVYKNVVYGGGGGGINVGYTGASNVKVVNNTVVETPGGRPGLWIQGSGHEVRNNIAWHNGGGDLVIQGDATVSHNLPSEVNPLFADEAGRNFRLQMRPTMSPAVNTGLDVGLPFAGTAPDIGACEMGMTPECGVIGPLGPTTPVRPTPTRLRVSRGQ